MEYSWIKHDIEVATFQIDRKDVSPQDMINELYRLHKELGHIKKQALEKCYAQYNPLTGEWQWI